MDATTRMAVAWAFPISLFVLLLLPFWPRWVVPLVGLIWILSLLIFITFPLYVGWLHERRGPGLVFFHFGGRGFILLSWLLLLLGLVAFSAYFGTPSWSSIGRWGLSSLLVVLILGLDLMGSTPVYKSGLHEDRLLQITLDRKLCRGAGVCKETCPTNVIEIDRDGLANLAGQNRCVQCGACLVQCPFDALYFTGPEGGVVTPDTVRRFKLNLLGKRQVRRQSSEGREPLA